MWNSGHKYEIVESLPADLGDRVSLDLEYIVPEGQTDVISFDQYPYCYSFTDQPGRAWIVKAGHEGVIQELLDSERQIIYWNFKGDYHVMQNAGLEINRPPDQYFPDDGMLYRFVADTNPAISRKLKDTAREFFEIDHPDWDRGIYSSDAKLKQYAGGDAELHLMCFNELEKLFPQRKSVYELECRLLFPLYVMERVGLNVAHDRLAKMQEVTLSAINKVTEKIHALAGHQFDITSPAQVSDVIYEELGLPPQGPRGKNGKFSTNKLAMLALEEMHPIVKMILLCKRLVTRKGTFMDNIAKFLRSDNKLHPDYLQCVTPTKRLAASSPNTMNQPKRHQTKLEEMLDVRGLFAPEPDCYYLKADYSQIEFRRMIYASQNPDLIYRMESGEDFHVTTANIIQRPRSDGKTFNYALCYGADEFSVQFRLNVSKQRAREIMTEFDRQYQGLRPWMEAEKEWSKKTGWSRTWMGPLRTLPDLQNEDKKIRRKAERNIVNDQIQGGCAEIFKIGIIRLFNRLPDTMLINIPIHDELLIQVHNSVPPVEAAEFVSSWLDMDLGRIGKYHCEVKVGPFWSQTYEPDKWIPVSEAA